MRTVRSKTRASGLTLEDGFFRMPRMAVISRPTPISSHVADSGTTKLACALELPGEIVPPLLTSSA